MRRLGGPTSAGFHRLTWDLRHPSFVSSGGTGPYALPGTYTVQAHRRRGDAHEPLGEPVSFEVVPISQPTLDPVPREEAFSYHLLAGELQRVVHGADRKVQETIDQVEKMKEMIEANKDAGPELWEEARQLEIQLLDASESIRGDSTRDRLDEPDVPSLRGRVSAALYGMRTTHGPTATHRRQYEIALEEYRELVGPLRTLLDENVPAFKRKLEAAGIPWTEGRPLPRLQKP